MSTTPTTAVSRPILVGVHVRESSASTLKLLTKKLKGTVTSTMPTSRPRSSGRVNAPVSTRNGCRSPSRTARVRRSAGRLSGSSTRLITPMAAAIPAVTKTGKSTFTAASSPPSAGPTMVPIPDSAPSSPNRRARCSGGVMSAR